MHAISLLVRLPYRNDHRAWSRLTPAEQRTLDNARDTLALRGTVERADTIALLAAYRRLTGAAARPDLEGGADEVTP